MREGWEYKKLKEIGQTQTGTTPSKSVKSYYGGEIPFIRPAELDIDGNGSIEYNSELKLTPEGALKSRMISANSILMCCIGSVGKTGYSIKDVTCNQQINTITPYEGYNSKFVYYALLTPSFQNEVIKIANSAKVTLAIISKGKWEEMSIPVPSLSTQESIVSELDKINELISLKKEQLKDYDNLAQSIFYDMFGDPIENPKRWEVKKIGDITEPTIGLTYKPENVTTGESGTIVLRSSNIQNSKLSFDDIVRVNIPIKEEKYVKNGDILMCSRNGSFNLVGKVAMIQQLKEPMSYGAFMTIIRSNYNPFLFGYFKTPAFREYLIRGKTTTVNQITVKMLKDIKLPLPPLPLQQAFAKRIEAIEKQKQLISSEIKDLETLLASRMQYWFD